MSEFYFRGDGQHSGYYSPCKKCRNKTQRAYRKINKRYTVGAYRRKYLLKGKYGITEDDYNSLLEKQKHRCGICGSKNSGNRHGTAFFSIDHCHITGKIRGLLCDNCNRGIGLLQDNVLVLQKAIGYLNETH